MGWQVRPFQKEDIRFLLPLVLGYQDFYGVRGEDARNRKHFLSLSENQGQVFLLWDGDQAVGFATFYFTFSSVRADRLLLLNDLYVVPRLRGQGAGRFLLQQVAQWAWEKGYPKMEWHTAPDNASARRLYDGVGGEPETWVHYTLTPHTQKFEDTPPL